MRPDRQRNGSRERQPSSAQPKEGYLCANLSGEAGSQHKMKLLGVMCLGVFCCAGVVHSAESEGERFFPISLKCPAENDQVLESVEKQRSGLESLIRVKYVNGVASIINLFGREKAEPDFSP